MSEISKSVHKLKGEIHRIVDIIELQYTPRIGDTMYLRSFFIYGFVKVR